MKTENARCPLLCLVGLITASPAPAQTNLPVTNPTLETAPQLPAVMVTAAPWETDVPAGSPLATQSADCAAPTRWRAPDSATLLTTTPGVAVIRNGPQTGIVQLRGLSGDRVKVSLDGMTITPACPNHMDPPLHYAAPGSVESLLVMAGITPVSQGGDSIGGTVLVKPPEPRFSTNDHGLGFGTVSGSYRSSNDGFGTSADAGVADRNVSAAYVGSWQTADDLRFPGGRVKDSGYDTQQHGLRAGWQAARGLWTLDGGYLRTRDAGTPALPMDMIEDDGYRAGLKYEGDREFGSVSGKAFFHHIDHLMDNYSLRPVAPGAMPMFSPATSDDTGLNLDLALPRGPHTWRTGVGFHLNAFDAYQQNAANNLPQDTFNDVVRTVAGAYLEWQADWSDTWTTMVGLRNDEVISDAGNINRFFPQPPVVADANRFNASAHDFLDVSFDVSAALRCAPNPWSRYELGFARKNRAPGIVERYLWTPLNASAGQADGRTYLGSLDLDSEVSHQVALTGDWHGNRWQFQVTPFYNFVTDYIQGTPIARVDPAGQPVLQFQNLDRADLYGVDALARYSFTTNLAARGTLSYVRGINRDNDDNLYRIAPLHGLVALDHLLGAWKSAVEVALVNSQDEVSAYNNEPTTPGYVLLNLRTGYTFWNRLSLEVGLENLTDEYYADHLGGINRVGGSDVAVGQRIPGAGRFVYVVAGVKF
ncbi:MAG: TonB-dependent receptor [Verrucomicrobia bacterium]|jgi:iron complex outermembrane receptor protein|nr:TonB-dependent receptor [Verrucomicrobiota bacterium]